MPEHVAVESHRFVERLGPDPEKPERLDHPSSDAIVACTRGSRGIVPHHGPSRRSAPPSPLAAARSRRRHRRDRFPRGWDGPVDRRPLRTRPAERRARLGGQRRRRRPRSRRRLAVILDSLIAGRRRRRPTPTARPGPTPGRDPGDRRSCPPPGRARRRARPARHPGRVGDDHLPRRLVVDRDQRPGRRRRQARMSRPTRPSRSPASARRTRRR